MLLASDNLLYRRHGASCIITCTYCLLLNLLIFALHSEGFFHVHTPAPYKFDDRSNSQQIALGIPSRSFFICNGITRSTGGITCLSSENNNKDEKNAGNWLEKASRLRKEALEIETTIERGEDVEDTYEQTKKEINYSRLEDSSWKMSYRFASEPTRNDSEEDTTPKTFYSGKISIKFRGDGYTNIIDDEGSQNESGVKITKFWGWDPEISSEDNLKYLSFSADVLLPSSDPNYIAPGDPVRFYFETRVDKDPKTGVITLNDGTVTLKKDIEPPGGFWGVFNAGGILAQFRYCGEFLCKPEEA